MALHHKMSQTVKIKVNRYTNIYLLMNLSKMYQFVFIFSCISALLSFIQQKSFLCRYRKQTNIYYSTWSFENVAKICQCQFLDPPKTHTLTIWGGIKTD